MLTNWKARALTAEAACEQAREHLAGVQLLLADRAALVSITTQGRVNRFTFVRNGQLHVIETYSTMDDNPTEWKKVLFE